MKKRFTWHADPGHAWLEVPRAEVEALGIMDRVSDYSYFSGDTLYLEEDCDAPRFYIAWEEKYGARPDCSLSTHTNGDSRIRRMQRVNG